MVVAETTAMGRMTADMHCQCRSHALAALFCTRLCRPPARLLAGLRPRFERFEPRLTLYLARSS